MSGTIFAHYQVLEKLGEGGMGVVYQARETRLRSVTLEILRADNVVTRRFAQDARFASPDSFEHRPYLIVEQLHERLVDEHCALQRVRSALAPHEGLGDPPPALLVLRPIERGRSRERSAPSGTAESPPSRHLSSPG
jgi:serine/threonine protein kinase